MTSQAGSRIIETTSSRVELVEPWKAGEHDPPMQEWLQLPLGQGLAHNICPTCDSSHFGTANPRGYFPVRVCHDEFGLGCRSKFRDMPDAHMIAEIFNALNGMPKRL